MCTDTVPATDLETISWLTWTGDPARWGKDHWSTFAYAETCAVDGHGWLRQARMREGQSHPTIAADVLIAGHSDAMCLEDMQRAGLLTVEEGYYHPSGHRHYTERERAAVWGEYWATSLEPAWHVTLSDLGWRVAGMLRAHLAKGGSYADFRWQPDPVPVPEARPCV